MLARLILPLLAAGLTACAALGPGGQRDTPGPVLLLGSADGVVTVDRTDGSVVFRGAGIPSPTDWSMLFTARSDGGRTRLEVLDAAGAATLATTSVPGELDVRVASPEGSLVALMPPLPAGASPWVPEARASTTITVASPFQPGEPRRYVLGGNFEPEAFSADGDTLYLIRYVPPMAPRGYRVAALDLSDGGVSPVGTAVKGVVETMTGTRLEQAASPDGSMLFTLYTTQGYAGVSHEDAVGFVHTLSLEEGWAHCIPLPEELWGGDPEDQAMAISPDGGRLYAVDTARGIVAVMDTVSLEMTSTPAVGLVPDSNGLTRAAIGPDGTLILSSGPRVVSLDPETFRPLDTWTFDAPVQALGAGPRELLVAVPGAVHTVAGDGDVGHALIHAPVVEDLAHVDVLER